MEDSALTRSLIRNSGNLFLAPPPTQLWSFPDTAGQSGAQVALAVTGGVAMSVGQPFSLPFLITEPGPWVGRQHPWVEAGWG